MLGTGLAPEEVAKRLVRLSNLEKLHAAQKKRIGLLEEQVRLFKQENRLLKDENRTLRSSVEDLKLQMEELRTIVFGKKQKEKDRDGDPPPVSSEASQPRSPKSYERERPRESEITETKNHPIDQCVHCGGDFTEYRRATYFEEDIPLPQKKVVVKHEVGQGYCKPCGRWSAGASLPKAPVVLGPNVRRYVAYLDVVCRQSYSQIQDVLKQGYDFEISQGEIAKILHREGERLRIEYERLKTKIRGEPSIHLDETGWNIFANKGERGYAWTMVGGISHDAVFALGKSRGGGNADDLVGDSKAVVVSDDYQGYRHLENERQLCCAHILRKLRDLAESKEIDETIRNHCQASYETFRAIYADIEAARMSPDPSSRHEALHVRLAQFVAPAACDPLKLARIKTQVRKRSAQYLTCLLHLNVASDNNAAERSLRHLVIKRKTSFGSWCERTAETMAILLSVLLSYRERGTLRNYLAGA